ncbi:hypothetical protein FXO38_18080 [Capsicum annuum]|nr:hypothetical protein FXO38_18080 [Capsicum annuum]KAF3651316.1 hypothetical protein FXO37_18062 [Capsicum annuum]
MHHGGATSIKIKGIPPFSVGRWSAQRLVDNGSTCNIQMLMGCYFWSKRMIPLITSLFDLLQGVWTASFLLMLNGALVRVICKRILIGWCKNDIYHLILVFIH